MSISQERFEQGLTYQQFRAQMTKNQDRFDEAEQRVQLSPEDVAAFSKRPLNVAVIAEDWCGDVIANLPILGRLSEASGKLNVRVFLRDQNPDLMDQYLKNGQFRSIPVFIFMDERFREIGVFQERPDTVTELRARKRVEIFQQNPEFGSPDAPIELLADDVRARLQGLLAQMREDTRDEANRLVVSELKQIVARAA